MASMNMIIGQIATLGTLSVTALGQTITQDRIWIAPHLLKGYNPQLKGSLSGTGYLGAAVSVDVVSGQLTANDTALSVGDRVVLLTNDAQVYYLMDKVVRYG